MSFPSPVRPISCKAPAARIPMVLPKLNTAQLLAFLASLNGKPNPTYCTDAAVRHAVQSGGYTAAAEPIQFL